MKKTTILKRISNGLAAVLLVAATAGVLINPSSASAAGQVSSRSIQMSSSAKGATASYMVQFTPATTAAQSIVIDFCSNSAVIGASCTAPTGMNAASATFTAGTGTTNWILGTAGASQLKLNKNTGSNLGTSQVNFTINSVVNPTNAGTFYARIYTFANTTYGTYSSATSVGNDMDEGGIALSATDTVSINATVQESLTFCVNKTSPGNACTSLSTPITVTLGTGSPVTLDANGVYTDTIYTQLSTNAASGAQVALKTNWSCTGLSRDSGSTCGIPGKGAFAAIVAGTAAFGLNVADGTGGTGTVSHNANYGTTAGSYGMGANVTSTYGDAIESSTGPVANVNSLLTYGATASATTPSGVYSATHTYIATGTF
jgi:hypothetical protein